MGCTRTPAGRSSEARARGLRVAALLALLTPSWGAFGQAPQPPDTTPPPSEPAEGLQQWGEWAEGEQSDEVGFAEIEPSETVEPASEPSVSRWSLRGFARSQWGLWIERFDDNPFAKARQNLDLALRYRDATLRAVASGHAEYDLAYLVERGDYDGATLDAYEWLVDIRDTFLSLTLSAVDITVGRQVVPWGQGDVVSPIDVVNPRDLREPGLSDLDDLRLAVLASRVGVFTGYHRLEAMVVHESFAGYLSPPLGPFSPIPALIRDDPALDADAFADADVRFAERRQGLSPSDQQYFARWSYRGPGIDLGVYAASALQQRGLFVGVEAEPDPDDPTRLRRVRIELDHPRYAMLGQAGALPSGDWLFKWELAGYLDYALNIGDTLQDAGVERAGLLSGMAGITYSGFDDTVISVEHAQSHLIASSGEPLFAIDEPLFAVRSRHTFLREDLRIDLAWTGLGWTLGAGWLVRGEATYRLVEELDLSLGAISYHPGDALGPFTGFSTHDRVFAGIRWDFLL